MNDLDIPKADKKRKLLFCPACIHKHGRVYACAYIQTYPCTLNLRIYLYTHVHTYILTYIHTYIHTHVYACIYIHTYIHMYMHKYIRINKHMYVFFLESKFYREFWCPLLFASLWALLLLFGRFPFLATSDTSGFGFLRTDFSGTAFILGSFAGTVWEQFCKTFLPQLPGR